MARQCLSIINKITHKLKFILSTIAQRGISSILIILIIVGVLVGGGLIWYYQKTLEIISQPTPQIVPPDETADWKTYRNEKYGFEFKYPQNYKEYKDPTWIGENEIYLREYTDKSMNPTQLSDIIWHANHIFVRVVLGEKSFNTYLNDLAQYEKKYSNSDIIDSFKTFIDGRPAIQQEYILPPDYLTHSFGAFRTAIDALPDMIIVIYVTEYSLGDDVEKTQLLKLHNKILSTFKFISQ